MTPEEHKQAILQITEQIFARNGQVVLMAVIVTEEDGHMVCAPSPALSATGDQMKEIFIEAVRDKAESVGSRLVAVMDEAWKVELSATDRDVAEAEAAWIRPSEHPDRKEILTVAFDSPDPKERSLYEWPIVRDEKGEPSLGEIVSTEGAEWEGRLAVFTREKMN